MQYVCYNALSNKGVIMVRTTQLSKQQWRVIEKKRAEGYTKKILYVNKETWDKFSQLEGEHNQDRFERLINSVTAKCEHYDACEK